MTDNPEPAEQGDRLVAAPQPAPQPAPPSAPAPTSDQRPLVPAPSTSAEVTQPVHRMARPSGPRRPTAWQRLVSFLAWVVRVVCRLAALVLVLYALFTAFEANPANPWYKAVQSLASWLSLGLSNLFQLADARWEALVNYGLAAMVWLIIGSVVASLIQRLAP
ncbi:hypothetical protein OIE66_00235 [Nonomuraea sp. NBC_01738]|uniref:hypothetical protein n=1 Tax=Nonomuraea sp. NBC_01738 TaxID=2976003 RepID=UPI002E10EEB4|nr:hypothetical protein OIE66_00235 [Nonomuraea sp. NBC_01738]